MNLDSYFKLIEEKVEKEYALANKARAQGLDPIDKVEILLATNLAEKSVGLVSTLYPQLNDKRIINRILELEKEYGPLDVAVSFKIAEEIAKEKFCKFSSLLEAIEAGARVGFAYITLGVVSSPIEGFTGIKLKKTRDGKDYFAAYFSGPIRSAGTTASCVVLMLIDYLREIFGFAKFDPDEKEIKRYVTENYDYHERVTNLQYLPTEEEIAFLASKIPIQIDGEPSEQREVSNFKDLARVETNMIRGGMCLCFSEGLAQKAQKGLRLYNNVKAKGFSATGWDFLADYVELHKKRASGTSDTSPTYIKDLVAGRPVFSHPSRSGGFRFRYGRSRVSGFSATSIHPATMAISNGFLSTGTQLKIEKPTKGCAITSCDSIDGPIVKLKSGSVKNISDFKEAMKIYKDVDEIIYFGDILFSLGDVMNRNYELLKPGYVEEWWILDLQKTLGEAKLEIDKYNVGFDRAVELSEFYKIPLHPKHIFFWSQINSEHFLALIDWLNHASYIEKIIFPYNRTEAERFQKAKRGLELLGVEHEVSTENVIVESEKARALLFNLGIYSEDLNLEEYSKLVAELIKANDKISVLEIVNKFSKYKIKDKAGAFIGARMGRPEKAKLRKLIGSPSMLFPVGEEGGRFRSIQEACTKGAIDAEFPIFFCESCKKETIYKFCETCNKACIKIHYCRECGNKFIEDKCEIHNKGQGFYKRKIDSNYYYDAALKHLGLTKQDAPALLKGVRGTSSEDHDAENLAKGVLRALHNLCVNKDGTIRYDATELPITHFKAREIGTSIKKLIEMGYEEDIYGKKLEDENQVLELKPHDIVLPACPDSDDEKADDVFFNITKFVDSLLDKFYKMGKFYNVRSKEDVIGQLAVCMAPHNCAGVVTRIIGFSKVQGILASPYLHAAVRRDCDGDEVAVMLLLEVLLNFSRKFLPSHRGGTQDAPLVLNARIRAGEVDDQILDLELASYPLEMYEQAERGEHSSKVSLDNVRKRLKEGKEPLINIGFSHDTFDFNNGIINSSYKSIPTMQEKVDKQMDLVSKLRAVDKADVARLVIDRHFMRDIRGNMRKFSQQEFRCVSCNEKFRRPPLSGTCSKCKGKIIFTISHGSIIKYVAPALNLARDFNVPAYMKQNLELTKRYIESIFGKEKEKQEALGKFFT
jgi:DNA polymerase II large subunit